MGFFSDDSKELNTKKGQTNGNLHKAKNAKNDEFYTQLTDIEKELMHYKDHFRDKVVYCNCDDPTFSNFWVYFHLNFEHLGLKKLIATFYHIGCSVYSAEYTGGNDNDCAAYTRIPLNGNGDFRSEECIEILKGSDIVVTNPPFSLFREYVAQLMKYEKSFIIWSNNNAITYKEFFPLLKDNKVWLGYTANKTCVFRLSDDYQKWDEKLTAQMNDGHKYGKCPAISIFTNLDIKKRHEKLILCKKYTPEEYPTYDNYDAINVDKVTDIPCDYEGVMGVPITFLDKYNPDQFEIVGFCDADSPLNLGKDYSDYIGYKQDRTLYGRTGSTFGKCPVIIMDDKKHPYYEKNGVRVQATYHRVFISKKVSD